MKFEQKKVKKVVKKCLSKKLLSCYFIEDKHQKLTQKISQKSVKNGSKIVKPTRMVKLGKQVLQIEQKRSKKRLKNGTNRNTR